MTEPMLMSVSEASKRLGLGEETVRALVKANLIGSVPIGRRNRKIPVFALDDYIRTQTEGGTR